MRLILVNMHMLFPLKVLNGNQGGGDLKSRLGLVDPYISIYSLTCMMGLVWGYMASIGCKYRSGADIIHHNQPSQFYNCLFSVAFGLGSFWS